MSDRANQTYSGLIALLIAAVILLIMISITEAAPSYERLMGNPEGPRTDHIRASDKAHGIPYAGSIGTFEMQWTGRKEKGESR